MVEPRELRRAEARRRRVLSKLGADQREAAKHFRVGRAIAALRQIVADETFRKLIFTHGIQSVPELLTRDHSDDSYEKNVLDASLDFIVAWRFFSPFLYEPLTAQLIEARWPGLGLELRDLFISIVADGPFPHELRGRPRRLI